MKKITLFFVALFTATIAFAYVEIDGIYYNLNDETKTAEVTYQEYKSSSNYSGLTSITIPEKVTCDAIEYNVTSIGDYAFERCLYLTSITIPNSVTSIGDKAFYSCSDLTSITIPNNITSIGDKAFSGTPWLNNQPDGCVYIGKCLYKYKEEMPANTHIDIKERTIMICSDAFYDCESLISITIPNSVTSIGVNAFEYCSSLTSITIPNSVTSIKKYTFSDCSSLTSITIPNSVTSIGEGAFYGCESLTSITIPDSVTYIGDDVFYKCESLKSITIKATTPPTLRGSLSYSGIIYIPNNTLSAYKEAWGTDYNFLNNENTLTVYVETPGTLSNKIFDAGQLPIEVLKLTVTGTLNDDDFTLMRVTMTSLVDIDLLGITNSSGVYFKGKNNLLKINLPENLTSIGVSAFYDCESLTSITIPNSVTSIGICAFKYCNALTSITIPNSVTSIGDEAFFSCSSLTSITCLSSTPPEASNLEAEYEVCTLLVPKGSSNDYKKHTEWGKFSNIQELEGETPSNLETSKISSANIYTTNGTLHIEGATSDYHILDTAGRLIYSGNATILTLPRGIYLVTINGEVEKIVL